MGVQGMKMAKNSCALFLPGGLCKNTAPKARRGVCKSALLQQFCGTVLVKDFVGTDFVVHESTKGRI